MGWDYIYVPHIESKKRLDELGERQKWIDSLPNRIDPETQIDKLSGSITDNFGNFIMSLPTSLKPKNIIKWFEENYESFDIE